MKFFIQIFLCFTIFLVYGQSADTKLQAINTKIATLSKQKESFGRDTNLVNALQEKGVYLVVHSNVDSAKATLATAAALSKKVGWEQGYYQSLYKKAEANQVKSEYFSTINESLEILRTLDKKKYPQLYAGLLRNIASSYHWLERPKESMQYYDLLEKNGNCKYLSAFTQNDILVERGHILFKYYNKKPEAYALITKALENNVKIKDTVGIAYSNVYLALVFEAMNKKKEAQKCFETAINLYTKTKTSYLLPDVLIYASDFYFKNKNYAKAEQYGLDALNIANRQKILFSQRGANFSLYNLYKAQNLYPKALFHFEKYSNARDSMAQATLDDRLKVVRYEYDTELQRAEIDKKTRENEAKNRLIYSLLFGIVAFGLAGLLAYRNTNIRKKIAEQEVLQLKQEKQLIATQSVLAGQEAERSRLAKDLHDGLGGLLSGIKLTLNSMTGNLILTEANARTFDKALAQLDNAMSEMRRVAHSMMPEALLKFGLADALQDYCENIHNSGQLKLHFQTIGLTKNMPQELSVHFYRIVQELLNNVIKHAQATQAQVQLVQDGQLITLTVEDNGRGFDPQHTNKGAGLESVRSRVAALGGHIDIHSDARGTSIEVQYQFPS